jgi:hypothetical protein
MTSTGNKVPAVRLPDLPVGLRWNVKVEDSYVYVSLQKHKKTKLLNRDKWYSLQSDYQHYWDVNKIVSCTENLAEVLLKKYEDGLTLKKISVAVGGVYEPVKS